MTTNDYLISAAKESKDNARQWFRYLRKVVPSGLAEVDLPKLLASSDLTSFQKITLRRAMNPTTATHRYVAALNQKRKIKSLAQRLEEYDR